MRRLTTAAALTAILLLPTTAHATSGWAPFHGHYVRFHTTLSKPSEAIAGDWILYLQDRARAIKRAKRANVRWAAFLAAQVTPGPTQGPSGGYAPPVTYSGDHGTLWLCIHSLEGSWTANTGNGYYGGLQMGIPFQQTYGGSLYATKGTADHWTPDEQIGVAEGAWATNGYSVAWLYSQWPVSGPACV